MADSCLLLIHVNVWQKPVQYYKIISLQLIKKKKVTLEIKAGTPVLWPPNVKSRLIGKDSDAVKDVRQKENGAAEDEMFRYHH